jgi:hypothetical protein
MVFSKVYLSLRNNESHRAMRVGEVEPAVFQYSKYQEDFT